MRQMSQVSLCSTSRCEVNFINCPQRGRPNYIDAFYWIVEWVVIRLCITSPVKRTDANPSITKTQVVHCSGIVLHTLSVHTSQEKCTTAITVRGWWKQRADSISTGAAHQRFWQYHSLWDYLIRHIYILNTLLQTALLSKQGFYKYLALLSFVFELHFTTFLCSTFSVTTFILKRRMEATTYRT